jgi:hypothetical protein
MAYQDLEHDLHDYPPSPDPGLWRGLAYVLGIVAFVLMIVVLFLL